MIRNILFDFGGTLDSDGLHWLDHFYQLYADHGFNHVYRSAIKEAFYWADQQAYIDPTVRTAGWETTVKKHVRWQFQKLKLDDPKAESDMTRSFAQSGKRILLRNKSILQQLHNAGYKLGIVSNNYGNLETICNELGYAELIDSLIDSAVAGVSKPDPKIFQLALEALGASALETGMVGDSFDRDILPAKALGMKTFWLQGPRARACPDLSQIDETLKSLEELPSRLGKPLQVLA